MIFSTTLGLLASALAASAADINVLVGDGGQLAFSPTDVQAKNGDTIHFEFRGLNHSVTQSTFVNPCQKSPTGIDSGFQAVQAGATSFPSWSFTVDNETAPLWFFCAQVTPKNHCQAGMVFAVNAPPDKTFQAYQANAMGGAASASTGGSGGLPSGTGPAGGSSATGGVAAPNTPPSSTDSATAANSTGAGNGAIGLGMSIGQAGVIAVSALLGLML